MINCKLRSPPSCKYHSTNKEEDISLFSGSSEILGKEKIFGVQLRRWNNVMKRMLDLLEPVWSITYWPLFSLFSMKWQCRASKKSWTMKAVFTFLTKFFLSKRMEINGWFGRLLRLFFKVFFILRCIKMIFFYFLKIIFEVSASKRSKI